LRKSAPMTVNPVKAALPVPYNFSIIKASMTFRITFSYSYRSASMGSNEAAL